MVGANLANTNVEGANLQGAFLGGSILAGTNFRNADLRRATIGCPRWTVPDQFGKLTSFEDAQSRGDNLRRNQAARSCPAWRQVHGRFICMK